MFLNSLEEAISHHPSNYSYSNSVESFCRKMLKHEVLLPYYQRDISWSLKQNVDLFNYMLLGKAPIAPISIHEFDVNLNDPQVVHLSFNERQVVELVNGERIEAIIDGQQRLTTIYRAYTADTTFTPIFLDLKKGKFCLSNDLESPIFEKHQIPVTVLLNQDYQALEVFLNERGQLGELYSLLIRVRSKMLSYSYTVNIAKNLTEMEQLEWFEILNKAGSQITSLELNLCKGQINNVDIYRDFINPFYEKCDAHKIEAVLPMKQNIRAMLALLNPALEAELEVPHKINNTPLASDAKVKLFEKHHTIIDSLFKETLKGLDQALSFYKENNLLEKITRPEYLTYLIGYFILNKNPTSEDIQYLATWVNQTEFKNIVIREKRDIYSNLVCMNIKL